MPNVRSMDGDSGISSQERWIAPPSLPVWEPAQVQHGGKDRGANPRGLASRQSNWPFLYSYNEGGCTINTAPRRSAYAQASDAGEALI